MKEEGQRVGRKRVERLMRQHGLVGAMPQRRRRQTTSAKHGYAMAENLLERDFRASAPNRKWVVDITYIPTLEEWLYLASVLDLFSRRIVGWAMSERIEQELTLVALRRPQSDAPLLYHSDVQYVATRYRQLLADWKVAISMSDTGNCYDNPVVESWHCMLKVELVWRQFYAIRQQARTSIVQDIAGFYNLRRRHSSLGYIADLFSSNDYTWLNGSSTLP